MEADAGQPVTISVSGPAVFSDANGANAGQQQQHVPLDGQSAAIFWVLLTGAGQADIHVALPYRLEVGTVYSQIDDSRPTQRLVMAESLNLVAQVSAQLSGAAGAPPAPTEQATTPVATSPPPPTRRPSGNHKTPIPAEQPTITVVAGEAIGATPVLAAEATALPAPTIASAANEQAGAAPVAVPALRPSKLPNTGGRASPI